MASVDTLPMIKMQQQQKKPEGQLDTLKAEKQAGELLSLP